MATFEYIIVESKGAVGVITLNRPKMLNALSFGVFREIAAAVDDLEADDKIGCILLTGTEKAFAAGADIKEMPAKSYIDPSIWAISPPPGMRSHRAPPQAGDRRGPRVLRSAAAARSP